MEAEAAALRSYRLALLPTARHCPAEAGGGPGGHPRHELKVSAEEPPTIVNPLPAASVLSRRTAEFGQKANIRYIFASLLGHSLPSGCRRELRSSGARHLVNRAFTGSALPVR